MKDYYVMKVVNYSDRTEVYHDYPGEIEYEIYDYSYSTCRGPVYYDVEKRTTAVCNSFKLYDDDYEYDERHLLISIENDLTIVIVRDKRLASKKDAEGEIEIYFRKDKNGEWNVVVDDTIAWSGMEYGCGIEIRVYNVVPYKYGEESKSAKEFLEMILKEKEKEKSS